MGLKHILRDECDLLLLIQLKAESIVFILLKKK